PKPIWQKYSKRSLDCKPLGMPCLSYFCLGMPWYSVKKPTLRWQWNNFKFSNTNTANFNH
ncbi:hypothetical protein ABTI36_19925, partial [Acinetobacter baumannii]